MDDALNLKQIVTGGGVTLFVRGYDEVTQEWTFATNDPKHGEFSVILDRGNPKRAELHRTLLDTLAGRNGCREGLRVTLGRLPPRIDDQTGVDLNEGKAQIVDIGETELSHSARKIVVNGEVIGEWSKDLERAVSRFSDVKVMQRAYDTLAGIGADQSKWQADILPRAIATAHRELKRLGADAPKLFSDDQLGRFAARNLVDALAGWEADGATTLQQRYSAHRPFPAKAIQKALAGFDPATATQATVDRISTSIMNFAVQRTLVDAIAASVAGDGLKPSELQAAEDELIADGQLLHGHPKLSPADFAVASLESGRKIGALALAGVMANAGANPAIAAEDPLVAAVGRAAGNDDPTFHKEVERDMSFIPDTAKMTEKAKLHAFLHVACLRLDRYAQRERGVIREEQIKAAVPQRKQGVKEVASPRELNERLPGLAAAERVNGIAKKGADVVDKAATFARDVEGIGIGGLG